MKIKLEPMAKPNADMCILQDAKGVVWALIHVDMFLGFGRVYKDLAEGETIELELIDRGCYDR